MKKKEPSAEHARSGSPESSHGKNRLGAVNGKVGRIEDHPRPRRGMAGALIDHKRQSKIKDKARLKTKDKSKTKDKEKTKSKRKDKFTMGREIKACMRVAERFGT